jgi:hypothetical protein
MPDQSNEYVFGQNMPWERAVGIVFLATHLTPFAAVRENVVESLNSLMPYGLLTVESPALPPLLLIPLTHRDEFLTLWEVFEGSGPPAGSEVLVAYVPNKGAMRLLGGSLPRIRVRVAREGQFAALYEGNQIVVTEAQVRAWFTPGKRCPHCNAVVQGFQLRCATCKKAVLI